MITLTEFLLARIAEDESDARSLGGELRGVPWQGGAGTPARVLAECEAKRRIVEDWREVSSSIHLEEEELMVMGLELAAQHLASVYADHPDYRDEWRA